MEKNPYPMKTNNTQSIVDRSDKKVGGDCSLLPTEQEDGPTWLGIDLLGRLVGGSHRKSKYICIRKTIVTMVFTLAQAVKHAISQTLQMVDEKTILEELEKMYDLNTFSWYLALDETERYLVERIMVTGGSEAVNEMLTLRAFKPEGSQEIQHCSVRISNIIISPDLFLREESRKEMVIKVIHLIGEKLTTEGLANRIGHQIEKRMRHRTTIKLWTRVSEVLSKIVKNSNSPEFIGKEIQIGCLKKSENLKKLISKKKDFLENIKRKKKVGAGNRTHLINSGHPGADDEIGFANPLIVNVSNIQNSQNNFQANTNNQIALMNSLSMTMIQEKLKAMGDLDFGTVSKVVGLIPTQMKEAQEEIQKLRLMVEESSKQFEIPDRKLEENSRMNLEEYMGESQYNIIKNVMALIEKAAAILEKTSTKVEVNVEVIFVALDKTRQIMEVNGNYNNMLIQACFEQVTQFQARYEQLAKTLANEVASHLEKWVSWSVKSEGDKPTQSLQDIKDRKLIEEEENGNIREIKDSWYMSKTTLDILKGELRAEMESKMLAKDMENVEKLIGKLLEWMENNNQKREDFLERSLVRGRNEDNPTSQLEERLTTLEAEVSRFQDKVKQPEHEKQLEAIHKEVLEVKTSIKEYSRQLDMTLKMYDTISMDNVRLNKLLEERTRTHEKEILNLRSDLETNTKKVLIAHLKEGEGEKEQITQVDTLKKDFEELKNGLNRNLKKLSDHIKSVDNKATTTENKIRMLDIRVTNEGGSKKLRNELEDRMKMLDQQKHEIEDSIALMWGTGWRLGRYSVGNNLAKYLKKKICATYVPKETLAELKKKRETHKTKEEDKLQKLKKCHTDGEDAASQYSSSSEEVYSWRNKKKETPKTGEKLKEEVKTNHSEPGPKPGMEVNSGAEQYKIDKETKESTAGLIGSHFSMGGGSDEI